MKGGLNKHMTELTCNPGQPQQLRLSGRYIVHVGKLMSHFNDAVFLFLCNNDGNLVSVFSFGSDWGLSLHKYCFQIHEECVLVCRSIVRLVWRSWFKSKIQILKRTVVNNPDICGQNDEPIQCFPSMEGDAISLLATCQQF